MEIYKIVLLILLLIVSVYVILLIYVFSHVHKFSKRMKRRLRALDIILSEKAVQALSAKEDFELFGIAFSEDDRACFRQLKQLKFEKSTYESVISNKHIIQDAIKRLSYIALGNRAAANDAIYVNIKASLDDLDRNFRRCCVLYNQDLLGYNYWIKIPGTRLWSHLFRLKPAKQIA